MRTGLVKPKVKESTTTSSDGTLDIVIAFDTIQMYGHGY